MTMIKNYRITSIIVTLLYLVSCGGGGGGGSSTGPSASSVVANAFNIGPNMGKDKLITASALEGTWYNSFCSRVDLTVSTSGKISGVYTSHTGSTGSSLALGYVSSASVGEAVMGIPFALGINWRLINAPIKDVDGSWHWVSSFSGQYHPAQTISSPGQKSYSIPETIELLNGLLATATTPFNTTSPVMWPQTLHFYRDIPSYCDPVKPPKPVSYSPTAEDNISGTWVDTDSGGGTLTLNANTNTGEVSGSFSSTEGGKYSVTGLFDTIAPPTSGNYTVSHQSFTIALKDSSGKLLMMTGGVDLNNKNQMFIWRSKLISTTWIYRFTQETFDKRKFTRI